MLRTNKWSIVFLMMLLAGAFMLLGVRTASAQDSNCVLYAGNELCGSSQEDLNTKLVSLRTANAVVPASAVVQNFDTMIAWRPSRCFGVTESKSDGFKLLLETKNITDMSDGTYGSRSPLSNEHGDWPPHLIHFKVMADRTILCSEFMSDISYRLLIQPKTDLHMVYSFKLDPAMLAEYDVMSSQGDLGLFIGSLTPIIVNGETLSGRYCSDCVNHTAAEEISASGVYTPGMLSFLGDDMRKATLDEVFVLPVEKTGDTTYNIELTIPAGSNVEMWFGRFDVPSSD